MQSADESKTGEKRRHNRHKCEASIEWSYFNTGVYYNAKLLNFSRGGVYIESAQDIMPGATIIIRLGKVLSRELDSEEHDYPRLVSLGEVTWRTVFSEGHPYHCGAGVRYPINA